MALKDHSRKNFHQIKLMLNASFGSGKERKRWRNRNGRGGRIKFEGSYYLKTNLFFSLSFHSHLFRYLLLFLKARK